MEPDPGNENARRAPGGTFANSQQHPHRNAAAFQTSSRPRRCPWYQDAARLAAAPLAPYGAWVGIAVLFAGSDAWGAADEIRKAGRRACTVLPPGADPAAIAWPAVRTWVGDAGDLPTEAAIELARALIDCGAQSVQLIGANLRPSLTMRRHA